MWRAIETARPAKNVEFRARGGATYPGWIWGHSATFMIARGAPSGVPLTHWRAEVQPGPKWRDPGDGRKSRFRDQRNRPVSTGRILRNAPRAVLSYAWFKLTGQRPARPWIPYSAAQRLHELLTPAMNVLEYGSGTSTLWFAKRARYVLSVDHDAEWISFHGRADNVTLVHASEEDDYCWPTDGPFDFIMIDGIMRDKCARAALDLIAPGGYIYLDNADSFEGVCADEVLADAMAERSGTLEAFTDFVPTLVQPTTGHLYRF